MVLIVLNPAFSLMLVRSPTWVTVTIFLSLQMALLWTLSQNKGTTLPSTLGLVLLGLALAPCGSDYHMDVYELVIYGRCLLFSQ